MICLYPYEVNAQKVSWNAKIMHEQLFHKLYFLLLVTLYFLCRRTQFSAASSNSIVVVFLTKIIFSFQVKIQKFFWINETNRVSYLERNQLKRESAKSLWIDLQFKSKKDKRSQLSQSIAEILKKYKLYDYSLKFLWCPKVKMTLRSKFFN